MINRFVLFVTVLTVFGSSSCSSSKKATKSAIFQDLDTVTITASRENPYHASATKYFDLQHTKLEVKFDYAKQYLYGKATLTLKPHFYPQKELLLDAKEFDIHEVSLMTNDVSREALRYTYDSTQLKITLNRTYTKDETLKIYIDYTAKPEERKIGGSAAINEDKGLYFINPLGIDTTKPIQIWTQGEAESNSCWFPTIDKPDQKCTEEIYITHLKKYLSLSNGTLVSSVKTNDSMVIDHWKSELPFAPYLVMMMVGEFSVVHDRWRDIPVDYYVEKDYAQYAKKIFGNTPEMIEFFSQKLGFDYPWAKYAQIVGRDYVSGAMENTSATLHGEFIQRNSRELLDQTFEEVISHELFHQWFGDLVTCESWSNVPLNESFATYGEYLWNEYKYGREFADYNQRDDYRKYMEESKGKNVDIIRFYYNQPDDMLDRHSYEKGGLILNYLRHVVGEDAFFKSLELYLKNNQFKPVEIHQLRLAFEEVTGTDLNWFFNQWFFNSGHPMLNISYTYDKDSVFVSIEQKQNTDKGLIYQLPFKVGMWYGKNMTSFDGILKKKSQTFAFKVAGKPDFIDFDPEYAVLCERSDNKTTNDYIFEYNNAPYYPEKYEALKKLAEVQKENVLAKHILINALNDNFFSLREFAINKLNLIQPTDDSVITIIQNIAKNDAKSDVRKAAIEKLSKLSSQEKYLALFEAATGDSSYEVDGAALKALGEADSKKALPIAKQFEKEKNANIIGAVADIYSKNGDVGYEPYFENALHKAKGFAKYSMFYYYANFLTRMDKSIVLKGIKNIEAEAVGADNHFFAGAAKGSLKRISKSFEDKKKVAQIQLSTEQDKTAKIGLQEQINNDEAIINETNDAISRLNKKD